MAAIAAASHAFAEAGLDINVIMDRLTRSVAEHIGDFCSVRLVEERSGELLLASLHHPDRGAVEMVRELWSRHSPSSGDGLFGDVISTGEPLVILAADPDTVRARVPAAFTPYHDERPIHGLIVVPMRAHDRTTGTMTAWRERADAPYDQHDVTLLQELADQAALAVDNARLYEASQAAGQAKASFLAIVSHELRTPLNGVLGYADLLEMGIGGELTEKQAESVERIKRSTEHLRRIVDELIHYAQLEAGQQQLEPRSVALHEMVEESVASIDSELRSKGLRFESRVPETIQMQVDAEKLRQVLLNLLTNAVRFTEEGSIGVEAEERDDGVRIEVRDTGIGISEEHHQQIFEPFWQVEHANTRKYGGTGLGLSLSRRLARAMGGDIEVRSEAGTGSTFVLLLPSRHGPEPDPVDP
jgi:signal transduction histidine kinase